VFGARLFYFLTFFKYSVSPFPKFGGVIFPSNIAIRNLYPFPSFMQLTFGVGRVLQERERAASILLSFFIYFCVNFNCNFCILLNAILSTIIIHWSHIWVFLPPNRVIIFLNNCMLNMGL
jgi:hypothetical protein